MKKEVVKRYAWEDALIDAQKKGLILNGALLVALKLARAINWAPADGRESGLYWKNDTAFESVGVGRSTFYEHRPALFEVGFFELVKGNLIPRIPELSAVETEQSAVETDESTLETEESAGHHPYSEDTYTVKEYSEDDAVKVTVSASASPVTNQGPKKTISFERSLNSESSTSAPPSVLTAVEERPEVSSTDWWDESEQPKAPKTSLLDEEW